MVVVFSFWFFKRILGNANIGNWQLHISTLWSQETLWHVSYCKSFHKKVFLVFRMRSFEKLFLFLRYVLFFLEFLINFHFFRFFRSMMTMMCDIFELWEDQPQALDIYFSSLLTFGKYQVPQKTNKFNFKYYFVIGIPGIFKILYSITFLTFPLCNNSHWNWWLLYPHTM